jgi:hypothetical protein
VLQTASQPAVTSPIVQLADWQVTEALLTGWEELCM